MSLQYIQKSYEYIDMLSTKIRFEQREHLFLVDLSEEDSRQAENLVLSDLDWGNSQRARIPTD
ncbi:hypothetical protein [Ligilactobacillus ruminis]|uniref:hypothetical protein n=1 Tax=Ligilactobacillus ruminis TaxID=1623 RepID=UPI0022DEC08B|nr:hypothetical protein [Ligilactobacillus ruminis]